MNAPRKLWRRHSDVVAAVAGAAAAAAGGVALLGWALGEPFLTSFGSGNIPMAPSTALLFLVFGATVVLSAGKTDGAFRSSAAVAGAISGGAVALVLLVASLRGLNLPVEHLGFRISGDVQGAPMGFMSPITAAAFLLAGAALSSNLLARGPRPGLTLAATIAGIVLVGGGGVFVLAYLAGEPLAYGHTFIPPAAPTSAALAALGLGTIALARTARGSRPAPSRLPAGSTAAMLGLFLVLAAGIVVTGLTWFRGRDRQFREQVDSQLAAIADLKASELGGWRAERIGDGRVLQGNETFLRLARGVLDGTATQDQAGRLRSWLEKIRASYGYEAIQVLDERGAARLALPVDAPPPCRVAPAEVAEVLGSGESRLLDLHRDIEDGPVHMAVLVPLVDEVSGSALGSVLLRIDTSAFLFPFLSRWPLATSSAESVLVRWEGDEAVYASELRESPGSALRLRIPADSSEHAVLRAALGRKGAGPGRREATVVATARQVPGSPWWLLARVDAAEAYAPLRERLWLTVFLMAGLLLAAGTGMEAIRRRELARVELARRQVEEERASLRDVIERSLNEVYLFDPETYRFRFVNRGAVRNLGYTPDELHAMTPLDIVPGLDADALRRLVSDAASLRGEARRIEAIQRRKDGTCYPVEAHLQRVDVASGPVLLAIVNDITERRAAEDRIRKLNRLYAVLSDVNQSIVRVKGETELGVEACRIAVLVGGLLEAWIGLREGEGDQLRLLARAPERPEASSPGGDEPPFPELTRRALREGTRVVSDAGLDSSAGGPLPAAAFPLLVDGTPAGVFLLVATEPGTFDQEELQLLDEMALDLGFALETIRREAARKEATKGLARSEKRFRTVARLSSDFSYSCARKSGGSYAVDWITDAFFAITGYTEAELRERGCWLFVALPEDRETATEPMDRLRPGEADEREFRILTRSGEVRWLVNRMECEADPDVPDGLRLLGAVRDVTISRRAELEIRQLNADLERRVAERTEELASAVRELETFAYSVSHDLKTPLRAVDGYSRILLEEHAGALNAEAVELLGRLRRGAQRMGHLVEGLLAYSRIERRELQAGPVEISAVVRSVLAELREEVEARGAEVVVGISRDVVHADREGLAIIFRNLVGNALKYSRADRRPRIEILAREAENRMLLSVTDDGIGFDMQYHDRVFEVFQRLHRLEDYGGTGIGLALVKKAAERMKGRVWAESEPDRGSTFYVELPG